jgi:hypothetical protein
MNVKPTEPDSCTSVYAPEATGARRRPRRNNRQGNCPHEPPSVEMVLSKLEYLGVGDTETPLRIRNRETRDPKTPSVHIIGTSSFEVERHRRRRDAGLVENQITIYQPVSLDCRMHPCYLGEVLRSPGIRSPTLAIVSKFQQSAA